MAVITQWLRQFAVSRHKMIFPREKFGNTFASTLLFVCALFGAQASAAQTVSPMESKVKSFTDRFVVQVKITNPYKSGQLSEIYLMSSEWAPIEGSYLSKTRAFLGGGESLTVTALVPFGQNTSRYIYICHAITPKTGGRGAAYRGEVCGKYSAIRLA